MAGYKYEEEREALLTDAGQRLFLKIRDRVNHLLQQAGAVRMDEAIRGFGGDSWQMLACVDRMVELNELIELTKQGEVAGQHRVFVRSWK